MIQRPNIVLVIIDDLGRSQLRFDGVSLEGPRLPFLEMMAARGHLFTNFYTMAACSSTRASLLTGLHPQQHGVGEALSPSEPFVMSDLLDTIWAAAQRAGYQGPALVGKNHLSHRDSDPLYRGCAYFKGTLGNPGSYYDWEAEVDGEQERIYVYSTEQIAIWAGDYIELFGQSPDPFFLQIAFHAAHKPFHDPPLGTYETPITDDTTRFYAAAEAIDFQIRRLFAKIPPQQAANTLWMVFSDNGSPADVHLVPSGQGKGTTGEGGVHNNLIVYHPQLPAILWDQLVSVVDIKPTLQDLMGDEEPHPEGSRSFVSALNEDVLVGRDFLCVQKHKPAGFDSFDILERAAVSAPGLFGSIYKLRRRETYGQLQYETLHNLTTAPYGEDGVALDLQSLQPEEQQALTALRQQIQMMGG